MKTTFNELSLVTTNAFVKHVYCVSYTFHVYFIQFSCTFDIPDLCFSLRPVSIHCHRVLLTSPEREAPLGVS
jgi:hypothetical protein